MDTPVAVMLGWLLAERGLNNIARLLTDTFGDTGVIAATIDTTDGTITAYPTHPTTTPHHHNQRWTRNDHSYTHRFDPATMPASSSAAHHIVVGVTSHNELLIINPEASRAAGEPISIESPDPLPIMRCWLLQTLTMTPKAQVAVTDTDLAIPATTRVRLITDTSRITSADTIVYTHTHTTAADPTAAITITTASQTPHLLLCDAKVASIYLANRYWPLWRRLELTENAWTHLTAAPPTTPATTTTKTTTETTTDSPAAAIHTTTVAPAAPPTPPAANNTAQESATPATQQGTHLDPTAVPHKQKPATTTTTTHNIGLYMLGPAYLLGRDGHQHSGLSRQGIRRSVEALMVLATHPNGISSEQWAHLLGVSPQTRRSHRRDLTRICGSSVITYNPDTDTYTTDVYCDWRHMLELTTHNPATASTENLTAAVALIRGRPFEDIPEDQYTWREAQLLKDHLIDQCADATYELATRQATRGDHHLAHTTARLGTRINPDREDLWLIASNTLETIPTRERDAFLYDLKTAIPTPTTAGLKKLLHRPTPTR